MLNVMSSKQIWIVYAVVLISKTEKDLKRPHVFLHSYGFVTVGGLPPTLVI